VKGQPQAWVLSGHEPMSEVQSFYLGTISLIKRRTPITDEHRVYFLQIRIHTRILNHHHQVYPQYER